MPAVGSMPKTRPEDPTTRPPPCATRPGPPAPPSVGIPGGRPPPRNAPPRHPRAHPTPGGPSAPAEAAGPDDALDHAAPDLLVDEHRVDDAPAVVDAPHLQELHEAGLGIDLERAALGAVGEHERIVLDPVVARDDQLRLEVDRQLVAAVI